MPEPRKQPARPDSNRRHPHDQRLRVSLTMGAGINDSLLGKSTRQPAARRRIRSRRNLLTAACAVLLGGILMALLRELFF